MRLFLRFCHSGPGPEPSKKWSQVRDDVSWKFGVFFILFFAVLLVMPKAHADTNDFVINDFHGKYQLFNDVSGGRMVVTEDIDLVFSDQNHGVERAIPTDYKDHSLKLRVLSVKRDNQEEQYTTYGQNKNEVLRIGDPGKTITGPHTYEVQYEMRNVTTFYEAFDEWYWDINGDQWKQFFTKVSAEVILPDGWENDSLPEASCYTGEQGSRETDCVITPTETGYTFATTMPLGPTQTLSVAVPVVKGVFAPRTAADWFRENAWQFVGLVSGFALVLYGFALWRKHGKDYPGRGVIIPEYSPPKGLSPAEVGLLVDYSVDNRDLSATIIDLAVRGYIRVHDEETKKFGIFKNRKFSLEYLKDGIAGLKPHEKELVEALFDSTTKGTIQDIATLSRTKMSSAATSIRAHLKKSLTKEYGFLEEKPAGAQAKLIAVGIASFMVLIFTGPGWGWIVGLVGAILAVVVFLSLLRRRSHAGVEAYEKIKGLELYMNTAEKDRLKMMQSVDRPYAEPSKTVHLFEKLLPFAVALGVEKSWAKQFDDIYKEAPGWYSGNYAAFSTVYLASSLTSGVSAMNSSFTASTSSSSSGSGGGGFSGGGGGGGGGGGW